MRNRVPRSAAVAVPALLATLAVAGPASAHGGATLAEGGRDGVRILLQAAEATTPSGKEAVDLSTVLAGPGTGPKATVTLWVRPSGGKTFRVETERDEEGVAHVDVATAGRGSWRDWDVSAVVRLTDGERLRVSNAEANPPGPEPAATAGGGATGADDDEAGGTGTEDSGSSGGSGGTDDDAGTSGGTDPGTATDGAGAATDTTTTGGDADTSADDATAADGTAGAAGEEAADVTGESDGAPAWVVPSLIVLVLAAIGVVLVRRRRAG